MWSIFTAKGANRPAGYLQGTRCQSEDYLNDIIARMPYHKKADREELLNLLSHKWILQHQDSVLTKQNSESNN